MRSYLLPLGLIGLIVLLAAAPVYADDGKDSRTPRRFYLGAVSGIGLTSEPSEFVEGSETLSPVFLGGIDLGFQRITGGKAFQIDTDLLPAGGVYRARASVVLGHGFTTKYSLPCAAPPGMACAEIYNYRHVRSVLGIKLGAELTTAPDGESFAVEAGFALRSQIAVDIAFMYDPERGAPGGSMDFAWQLGPFYWGMEMRGLASKDEPIAMLATFVMGYTPRMWTRNER